MCHWPNNHCSLLLVTASIDLAPAEHKPYQHVAAALAHKRYQHDKFADEVVEPWIVVVAIGKIGFVVAFAEL